MMSEGAAMVANLQAQMLAKRQERAMFDIWQYGEDA